MRSCKDAVFIIENVEVDLIQTCSTRFNTPEPARETILAKSSRYWPMFKLCQESTRGLARISLT